MSVIILSGKGEIEMGMPVPELGLRKDLDLCRYLQMVYIERLAYYRETVKKYTELQAEGHIGKIERLIANSKNVIKMLEEMMEER